MSALPQFQSGSAGQKVVCVNRRALRDYHVLERIEAGIELLGSEIKSIREGRVSLDSSFARIERGEAVLYNMNIAPYSHSGSYAHDPLRPRRLLLHRSQIRRLWGQTSSRGYTLIPLRVYLKRGWAKVELGLCRGKRLQDRREELRRRTADQEVRREVSRRR